jgi:hypothetical protein
MVSNPSQTVVNAIIAQMSHGDYAIILALNAEYCAPMAKKRKPTPFRATKAVKSMARDAIGSPPPTRVVPEKTKQTKEKHKPTLSELLSND